MPLNLFNLNFFTTSLGFPTCLKISIDFPYPTNDALGKFDLISGFSEGSGMDNHYWSFVVKNCGVKIDRWVMKKTSDILISMMF